MELENWEFRNWIYSSLKNLFDHWSRLGAAPSRRDLPRGGAMWKWFRNLGSALWDKPLWYHVKILYPCNCVVYCLDPCRGEARKNGRRGQKKVWLIIAPNSFACAFSKKNLWPRNKTCIQNIWINIHETLCCKSYLLTGLTLQRGVRFEA
jgi:hypothetical protein